MKYIVLRRPLGKGDLYQELPVIFPSHLVHEDVARAITTVLEAEAKKPYQPVTVVAAGELPSLVIGGAEDGFCSGKSESLRGIKSRGPVDDALITMHDYLGGIL